MINSLPRRLSAEVRKAMDYITSSTPCITFVPKTSSSVNYVTILPGPDCSSELGMRGGEQVIYLNSVCFDNGMIVPVHQLLHTLGFVHEHNRTLVLTARLCTKTPFLMLTMNISGKRQKKATSISIRNFAINLDTVR